MCRSFNSRHTGQVCPRGTPLSESHVEQALDPSPRGRRHEREQMSERLRPGPGLLALESASTPMHNATVEIFEPGDSGFDYDRLVELIRDRISFVPRYRQRIQTVPGRVANPVWVDDELRPRLPRTPLRPAASGQPRPAPRAVVGRIISRPLDRARPLWEMYFVEGLSGGRIALLSKSHHVLVDGVETVDLGQVLLDVNPERKVLGGDEWRPEDPASTSSPWSWRPCATRCPTRERSSTPSAAAPAPCCAGPRPRPRAPGGS